MPGERAVASLFRTGRRGMERDHDKLATILAMAQSIRKLAQELGDAELVDAASKIERKVIRMMSN
jgi:hypothetical protein